MAKNLYQQLGFKPIGEIIYQDEIVDKAKDIFNALPIKLISIRNLVVAQSFFEEAYAISTAEDEELSSKEAHKIHLTPEIEARISKYKEDISLTDRKKYESLQFENIESAKTNISPVGFKNLTVGFICKLHYDLTIGLDNYSKKVGVSKYHPGKLRKSDRIKVGNKIRSYKPPESIKITSLLKSLFADFSSRKTISLSDIFEFHILFYAIHPFQNGNKRVIRLIESMLIHHYNYGAQRLLSMAAYYGAKREGVNFFLIESLRQKNPMPFVNFALQGYFSSGYDLFRKTRETALDIFKTNYKDFISISVKESKITNYLTALKAIVELNGVFSFSDFANQMKKHKLTPGISQTILVYLKESRLIKHRDNLYYVEKMPELESYFRKLLSLLFEHGIKIDSLH